MDHNNMNTASNNNNNGDLFLTFLVRLVLEVVGGGGAVWGFSEACGLRNSANSLSFWRPVALSVACLFFFRWLVQLRDAILERRLLSTMMMKTKTDLASPNSSSSSSYSSKYYQNVPTTEQQEDAVSVVTPLKLSSSLAISITP